MGSKTPQHTLAEAFFKAAFCIDGEAKMVSLKSIKAFKVTSVFQLTDSKRGMFYIATVSPPTSWQEPGKDVDNGK